MAHVDGSALRCYDVAHSEFKSKKQRDLHVGQSIAAVLIASSKPMTIYVGRDNLSSFIRAIGRTAVHRFVLLTDSNDEPLTIELQDQLVSLRGLAACFATNLHSPRHPEVFHPIPLGIFGRDIPPDVLQQREDSIRAVQTSAKAWHQRDPRLLITPMSSSSQYSSMRRRCVELLSREEFRHLVRVADRFMNRQDYFKLLSEHRSVLSPPGLGHDCWRTWEALTVGSVPLVLKDTDFDQRIFKDNGVQIIPSLGQLTPVVLEDMLAQLCDPAQYNDRLQPEYWNSVFGSYLAA